MKLIQQDNRGVTKFLNFTKLMDLVIAPHMIKFYDSRKDHVYHSFLQKKTYSFNGFFSKIYNILIYLSIRYDFNHFNEYLLMQSLFKSITTFEKISSYYDIDVFCLYFVKLKIINPKFSFANFMLYDDMLHNTKLRKKFSITEFDVFDQCFKSYFNRIDFFLNADLDYNFDNRDSDDLPLNLIKIPFDTRQDVANEMVFRFLVNFYCFQKGISYRYNHDYNMFLRYFLYTTSKS